MKEILDQYYDLKKEINENRKRIEKLEARIDKLEKRISDIEEGETVIDKVRGGIGGLQSFTIEGIPTSEYGEKKMELKLKRILLRNQREYLNALELNAMGQVSQIERYICSIDDSHIRRIVHLRVVDGLSWGEVAIAIGGGNTEDSVRMAYNRYVK